VDCSFFIDDIGFDAGEDTKEQAAAPAAPTDDNRVPVAVVQTVKPPQVFG